MPRPILLLLLVSTLAAQDRSPADLVKLPVAPGATRISYGPDPLQFAELRLPPGRGPHPVAIIVHGGCWVSKLPNLDANIVALDLLRPIAAALTDLGIATWNIEYRRLGNPGGGWPGTFQDVARATDHLRQIARANHLDLSRVVVMGHSAGGHLALWLAARSKLPPSSELYSKNPLPLKGVVDLDGPGDLQAVIPVQEKICGAPVINQLVGASPADHPERYRETSPIEMLPIKARQEVFAGRMFAAQTPAYEAAVKNAGGTIHTVVLPQASHFVFVDPGSAVWPQVVQSVKTLLER